MIINKIETEVWQLFGGQGEIILIFTLLLILAWVLVFWNPPKWLKKKKHKSFDNAD